MKSRLEPEPDPEPCNRFGAESILKMVPGPINTQSRPGLEPFASLSKLQELEKPQNFNKRSKSNLSVTASGARGWALEIEIDLCV